MNFDSYVLKFILNISMLVKSCAIYFYFNMYVHTNMHCTFYFNYNLIKYLGILWNIYV